ncbi:MAG: zinc metallopeptidase [Planctomycetota bacterium]|nr:zinc metallopeptidase [Planctomycetota bacterium]MDA1179687.1 zinc metallopeptidase [Planctomycetota bacterium]
MYDLTYILVVMLPSLAITGLASWMVQAAFRKYSQVGTRRGYTGAQAAQKLLDRAGIHDVRIVAHQGFLSDHYNPVTKQLALSSDVFRGNSIAAIGVATHEAGHAIQHAQAYAPLWLRSALVPTVGIGSQFGLLGIMLGIMMGFKALVLIGAVLFGAVLLFQIVTLPVEFDATARAKRLVVEAGIVDADERRGMDRVLNAAALTYVAAVLTSLLTLFYYLMRAGLFNNSRDD